ncbi:MAG: four helix bundle protein [Bacteroidota bacterium]
MKSDNLIQTKSFEFAIDIINLYKYLTKDMKEYVLSKQLLRSGTSIGANVEEAIGAQSKADFMHKLTISYKEARETLYWIKLLSATHYISTIQEEKFIKSIDELCRIIGSIQITLKRNIIK